MHGPARTFGESGSVDVIDGPSPVLHVERVRGLTSRNLRTEVLVLDPERRVTTLRGVGALIWQALEVPCDLGELVARVVHRQEGPDPLATLIGRRPGQVPAQLGSATRSTSDPADAESGRFDADMVVDAVWALAARNLLHVSPR